MIPLKRMLYPAVLLVLAACTARPASFPAPTARIDKSDSVQIETPAPNSQPAKPVTLAESVPVAVWKDSSQDNFLVPIDPASGQALPDYEPISLGQAITHVFSPDQHTLAVIGFESSEHPRGCRLHLVDLRTWKDRVYELQLDGYVIAMAFSPDGKRLGIANGDYGDQASIFDLEQAAITGQSSVDFFIYKMNFNADASGLMVYGSQIENRFTVNEISPNSPMVVMLDSTDLSVRWKAYLPGVHHGIVPKDENADAATDLFQPGQAIYLYPGLAFAPERDILYVVHPDEDKLTTVDFAAQKVTTTEIKTKLSWIERLLSLGAINAHAKVAEGTTKSAVISPDGQFLYIVGQRNELAGTNSDMLEFHTIPLGLQIVSTKDGSRLAHYDTETQELSISANGRYLYLRSWGTSQDVALTQIFDTSTNQTVSRLDGTWLVPTRRVDGKPFLGSSVWMNDKNINHNSTVDPQNLSVMAEWDSSDYLAWLTTQ